MLIIQVGAPAVMPAQGKSCIDLAKALDQIFPDETERAIFKWNAACLPVSYKQDLSVMTGDLATMLSSVLENDKGQHRVQWKAPSFDAIWLLDWLHDRVQVTGEWRVLAVNTDIVRRVNERNVVEMPRGEFLAEWKCLLKKILQSVEVSGIQMADREDLSRLTSLASRIEGRGYLYRAGGPGFED